MITVDGGGLTASELHAALAEHLTPNAKEFTAQFDQLAWFDFSTVNTVRKLTVEVT